MTIKSKTKDTLELNGLMDYKIASRINQSSIFQNAVNGLKEERCLVIFPEGCSHEYTDLIPLKAGASVIGLETMSKYKDTDLNFVCCGLKYSHPSRFRSRVTVEFGTPFKIDSELVQEYEIDRASASNKFLEVIESKLREVIFTAPSYKEMSSIYLAKRLYLPTPMNSNFTKEEINDIYKKIFNFYNSHKEEPDVKQLFEEVYDYGQELKSLGVRDSHIFMPTLNSFQYLAKLLCLTFYLIILLLCLSPGLITMTPLGLYARSKAEKLRIKSNGVSKTVGLDEVSSSRIITVFTKLPHFCIFIWTFVFIFQLMYTDMSTLDAAKNCFYFLVAFFPYCYICVIASDKIVDSYVKVKFLSYLLFKKTQMKELRQKRSDLAHKFQKAFDRSSNKTFDR